MWALSLWLALAGATPVDPDARMRSAEAKRSEASVLLVAGHTEQALAALALSYSMLVPLPATDEDRRLVLEELAALSRRSGHPEVGLAAVTELMAELTVDELAGADRFVLWTSVLLTSAGSPRALALVEPLWARRESLAANQQVQLTDALATSVGMGGDAAGARRYLSQGVGLLTEQHPDAVFLRAELLARLAEQESRLSQEEQALRHAREALVLARQHTDEHSLLAPFWATCAKLELHSGGVQAAVIMAEDAAAALAGDDPAVLDALLTLLRGQARTEATEAARVTADRILTLAEGEQDPFRESVVLNDLGTAMLALGDNERARALLTQSLAALEGMEPGVPQAAVHHNLAKASRRLGLEEEARRHAERAVALFDAHLPEGHLSGARARMQLARLVEPPRAAALVELAIDDFLDRLGLLTELSERQALVFTEELYEALAAYLQYTRSDDAQVYRRVLRLKGAVGGQELARLALLHAADDPETVEAVELLRVFRQTQLRLVFAGPLDVAGVTAQEQLEIARAGEAYIATQLAALSRDSGVEQVALEEICAALPADAAMVDFVDTASTVEAFVVRPAGCTVTRVQLGPTAALGPPARRFAELVAADAFWARAYRVGESLHALLWAPLLPALGDAGRVWTSPDGVVGTVPFAALPSPDGTLVLEQVQLTRLPWAGMLTRAPGTVREGLLLVGDVDYGPRSTAPAQCMPRNFTPLAATASELADIAAVWRRHGRGREVRGLSGREAREPAVRELAAQVGVLHLATHGLHVQEGCAGLPALSRQALALTGANDDPRTHSADDGLLTATEVALERYDGVELVVLSACETALGDPARGEGMLGLGRAFLQAGAGSLVTSLWQVPDADTARLMRELHRGLLGRDSPAAALREAQLRQLAADRRLLGQPRPFAWAAWVVSAGARP